MPPDRNARDRNVGQHVPRGGREQHLAHLLGPIRSTERAAGGANCGCQ